MEMFKNLSEETKIQKAIDLVITDAISKGKTDTKQLIAYMDSKVFENAVKGYINLFNNN